jgi:hypothetical protein
MKKLLVPTLLLLSSPGCIFIPTVPHYDDFVRCRGRIPESAMEFIKDGKTPLSEVMLKLGEPDWVGDGGKLIVYRWEMVRWHVITLIVGAAFGTPEFLVLRVNDLGICLKHRTVSSDEDLRVAMKGEFAYEWQH